MRSISSMQMDVWEALERGVRNAKKISVLMNELHISKRQLWNCIEALRDKGYPIGSLRQRNGGYFIIKTQEERDMTVKVMKAQGYKMIKTANKLSNLKIEEAK